MDKEELRGAIADLNEPKVLMLLTQLEGLELSNYDINHLINAVQGGMSEVGNRFEMGEYFVAELLFAAEISKQVMKVIQPQLIKIGYP